MKKKAVELFAYDKNGTFCFQDDCKLSIINLRYSKTLKVEPNDKDFLDISAFFRWKFIQNKNLLFVFAELNIQDFVLIFANEEVCKKVRDIIYSHKEEEDSVEKEELHQRLLIPIFQKIPNHTTRFKRIMLDWIGMHEEQEKIELLQLLKEQENFTSNHNIILDVKNIKIESNTENGRKRRFYETDSTANAEDSDFINDNFDNIECENDVEEIPPKKEKVVVSPTIKIINESIYKMVNFKFQNTQRRKLLIFTSSEKLKCYEYSYHSKKQMFYHFCHRNAKSFKAIIKQDENGNDCIKYEDKRHKCFPIQYHSEKYIEMKVIKKPDYEMSCSARSKRMLIIFDPDDRSLCYELSWSKYYQKFLCCGCASNKRQLFFEICHEDTENEYIRLINGEHVCEKRIYNPDKFNQTKGYVLLPDYEIQIKTVRGTERKTLIIFEAVKN